MYLRHDRGEPIFVPEDGRNPTSTMLDPVRDADPQKMRRGLCMSPKDQRVHDMVIEFFGGKLERCDKREKALIRFFLTKVGKARLYGLHGNPNAQSTSGTEADKAGENPNGIFISIRNGLKPGTFELYAHAQRGVEHFGAGCVESLPRLNLDATDALQRIFREALPRTVTTVASFAPARLNADDGSRGRSSKPGLTLIPGK
jgi:hypothetical protein